MTQLGVKNGALALFDADGRPATPAALQAGSADSQVLRGGLRATLLPLGMRLLQDAGVARGDAFILVLDNDRTSVACMLGAMQLQCVCALVGKSRLALLDHVRVQTGISKAITVNDTVGSVEVRDETNPQAAGEATSDAVAASWLLKPEISTKGCVCMLTSGSVGQPKVVACSWEHMLLQGESTQQGLFPQNPARIICGTSISHAFSINTIFALFTSPYDAQSELCFASTALGLYSLLRQRSELFTALYATPGTYTALAAMPPTALHVDVPYCAGTRLSLPLFRKMRDQYGLQLMQNYGSTEMGDMAAWYLHGKTFASESRAMASNEKQLYVGSVWPGVEVRVDSNGEVTMKTPWQAMGYVREHVLHRFNQSAHRTADLGSTTRDEDGTLCVWLQGRLRPTVEVEWQGQRLVCNPKEIENVLVAHPSVSDALVLIQDPANRTRGSICARVALKDGAAISQADLQHWCVEHNLPALRDSLRLESVQFLPCSPAGKLMYT
ncbi:hypothetical protein BBJ28_00005256 [Nothophytophthora sp. Chile5]|nr:hypothetical protein BBJ28_00005256 [Nothophytophthora sp. Chile5]